MAGHGRNIKHFNAISFKEAKLLSTQRYSCVQELLHNMRISMSPKYLSNIRAGLRETLRKELFVYNEHLEGVPIAFEKIKVISSKIVDDQDFFSLSISVLFMVFKPEVGKILLGKINKITDHHYGCIIHNCINGSLRHPKDEYLTDKQQEMLQNIQINNEVLFKVYKLDIHHDILLILGDIAQQFYQKTSRIRRESQMSLKSDVEQERFSEATIKREIMSEESETDHNDNVLQQVQSPKTIQKCNTEILNVNDTGLKKKKKKKKRIESESEMPEETPINSMKIKRELSDTEESSSPVKKKKKKKKKIAVEE